MRAGAIRWAIAGGLMGLGTIAFGLGMVPLLIGSVIALMTQKRFGRQRAWVGLVALGVVPAVILSRPYIAPDPNTSYGPDPWLGIVLFGAIAVAGVIWGVIER